MQVQVASSPLVLHVLVLLFIVNTITRTQLFSRAEEKHVESKRGYLSHPGYFSRRFGHLYSAEDFFPREKNESIQAGISSTRHPLYTVSPAMFQQLGPGKGSNLRHAAARGDATESEENYSLAKHHHDESPHTAKTTSIQDVKNPGLKGNKGQQKIAKLPQTIPFYDESYKKGKGIHKPPVRFTIPPEYTKTTEPVNYLTKQVTIHPTTTENDFYTTRQTTSGVKGKGHHKPQSKFTIPPEYTQTTQHVQYPIEPVTVHPITTEKEISTTHPTTSGVKKGKGHHKPASKFTIPSEYTQTTEPVHYATEHVTMHPTTTEEEIFTTHQTIPGVKKGKGHHKPGYMFTIPSEYTRTTEPVHYPTEQVTMHPTTTEEEIFTTHQTTPGVKKGKGHHKPGYMFTLPPEYTRTTEPVHYPTEQVTMHPTTMEEEIFTTHQTTPGVKKGKGHHKPGYMFTIPPEYTRTTEPVHYPTEQVTMHPTTTEEEIFTKHQTTPGVKKGKGHHKPEYMFTIPPEYTRITEPVHYTTEAITSYPKTTQEVYITQPTHSVVKKGKGHHKPASKFTIPSEYTRTTEPVHYTTEEVTSYPETTQEVYITHPTHSVVKKGKGHHKPGYMFTIPPEYTRTTEPATEQVTMHPTTTEEESFTTHQTTPGVKKGKGHHKPTSMFTIPPEYTRSTMPVYYSTEKVTMHPTTFEEVYITQPTVLWVKKGKGNSKQVSKFTVPPEYTMSTQSGYSSRYNTDANDMFQTHEPINYDQSTFPVEFSTLMSDPHQWQTSTIKYSDPTHPYHENEQSIDEKFTVSGYEGTIPGHLEIIGNPEDLATSHSFSTETPIKYEIFNPETHHITHKDEIQIDSQSTEYPHFEEFSTTHTNPPMQHTEPSHYQTVKYTDFDQATVRVEMPIESSTKYPYYEEFSTTHTDPSMQYTQSSMYYADKHNDDDQATAPVEIPSESSTKKPHYGFLTLSDSSMQHTTASHYQSVKFMDDDQVTVPVEISTQSSTKYPNYQEFSTIHTDSSMQYTEPSHYQSVTYTDDDQATVPVEIPIESSTKYPHYEEFSTTHTDPLMQYTESSQYNSVKIMGDDQTTIPVEIPSESSTKYPHYEEFSTDPSMQYTETSHYKSVKYTDDDQVTVPIEIPSESSTKYPHYEEFSTTQMDPSIQYTESSHYVDKHTDDDQAMVPVEIPSESSSKDPHYGELSTTQTDSSMQHTKPSHYHSVKDSDDQATVPIEVAIETTTQMESHHIESTSSYKHSTEFDFGLQAKVPLFPSENDEQHHLNVDFNDDDEDDADQQSITHPYSTYSKASTQANSPSELDWRSGGTVVVNHNKKYTVAPSDFFLTPIAPFGPVEFIPPQRYKEWPSHSSLNITDIKQVKVPDTIQVDLKGYQSYAENRPGIKGRGGRHNMISKPWYFMSRTFH